MYQLNETEDRHESLQEAEHHAAHRNSKVTQPHTRLRVVRVPGGFAYLEEEAIADRDGARAEGRHRP